MITTREDRSKAKTFYYANKFKLESMCMGIDLASVTELYALISDDIKKKERVNN